MKRIKWGTAFLTIVLLLQLPVAALALEVNMTEHLNMEGIERICITAKDCSLGVFPSDDAQAHITSSYKDGDCEIAFRSEDASLYIETTGRISEEPITGAVALYIPMDAYKSLEISLEGCVFTAGTFEPYLQGNVSIKADGGHSGCFMNVGIPKEFEGEFSLELIDRTDATVHIQEGLDNYAIEVNKLSADSNLRVFSEQTLYKEEGNYQHAEGEEAAARIRATLNGVSALRFSMDKTD